MLGECPTIQCSVQYRLGYRRRKRGALIKSFRTNQH